MALTRKSLKAMGIEDEKIDQIIDDHAETVAVLKDKIATAEKAASDNAGAAEQVEALKREIETLKTGDGYQAKYEKEHEAFEAFKAEVEAEKQKAEKSSLYRKLLTEAGVADKYLDAIMRVANVDEVEVKDGAIADAEKLTEALKESWADFIPTTNTQGASVSTPPRGAGNVNAETFKAMTLSEQMAYANQHPEATSWL